MSNEPFGTESIERYLVARGYRYYRGHHDGEFFFILTAGHERLHVHLEIPTPDRDVFTIRVMPAYFYPAAERVRLETITDTWNRENRRVNANVYESCDQTRIGVVAGNSYSVGASMPFDEFAELADSTIQSAIKLFAQISHAAEWKDAG